MKLTKEFWVPLSKDKGTTVVLKPNKKKARKKKRERFYHLHKLPKPVISVATTHIKSRTTNTNSTTKLNPLV
jgi:hypothetical protein